MLCFNAMVQIVLVLELHESGKRNVRSYAQCILMKNKRTSSGQWSFSITYMHIRWRTGSIFVTTCVFATSEF